MNWTTSQMQRRKAYCKYEAAECLTLGLQKKRSQSPLVESKASMATGLGVTARAISGAERSKPYLL